MKLTAEQSALCLRVARQVARTQARRAPWIDPADLEQEAWLAILRKIPDIDTSRGEPGALLHTVATVACKRLVWRLGAIATAPRSEASRGEAARQRACSVDETAILAQADDKPIADKAVEQAEARQAVAQELARMLANGQEVEAVLAVLSGEQDSAQASEAHGIPLRRLYTLTYTSKAKLRACKALREVAP